MEYLMQPVNSLGPGALPGHGVFTPNNRYTPTTDNWTTSIVGLRNQQAYLEDLLSKTAMTLNALRDRQTRNERALSVNPSPRSKKKKIQQNRWRTDKTIKSCENEERVLLDCLRVCRGNINTLECMISAAHTTSPVAECSWSASQSYMESESTATEFDWNGWADEGDVSPFQKRARRPALVDDVPPEASLDGTVGDKVDITGAGRKPPALPPRSHPPLPGPSSSTARMQCFSSMSPAAACFEPSVTHVSSRGEEWMKALDKLTISGLLASKRVRALRAEQWRRHSEEAIGRLSRRLSGYRCDAIGMAGRRHASYGPDRRQGGEDWDAAREPLRRVVTG